MLVVGENAKKFISDYSGQFQRDFLQLLRTSHGEKKVQLNHFYQEYISNKEHVHMNATKWPSLTVFAQFLGKEGICRVEEDEKGIHVAWIDNSPEALRRQDAIRKKERQDRGDEEREQALIREQVMRAQMDAEARGEIDLDETERELKRAEGEKIKLKFGAKPAASKTEESSIDPKGSDVPSNPFADTPSAGSPKDDTPQAEVGEKPQGSPADTQRVETAPEASKVSLKIGFSTKPKNVFSAAKKNALGVKKAVTMEQPKKMSEAERIMKEEMERKSKRSSSGFGGLPQKKPRF
jgi:DNA/RNA-binding protein KIN17